MIVGVPKEIKSEEARVALVPSGVAAFIEHGHTVLIEKGAGLGSAITDKNYRDAGAKIVSKAEALWDRAKLIIKVKEPMGKELRWMNDAHIVYTYFHLASNESLTKALLKKKVTAVAYETIQLDDGSLPLLIPMSEVAGRLAVQKGAQCLESTQAGIGILLSGVSGVRPANVVILGAGIAGLNACQIAVGMGAHVSILDINPARLRYIQDLMGGHVTTVMANTANITEEVLQADLLICTVLRTGARTPQLVSRKLVRRMKKGSAIVDISIDQGGCCETSHATTHADPTYIEHGVIHYCVSNMPGAVPRTATYALTNATLLHGLAIADHGVENAMRDDSVLARGLNTYRGEVAHLAVADTFKLDCHHPFQ
ncbi:MAG: alanine dehydrogenase [Candidatus Hydrogenedentota bacterium]